MSDGKHHHWWQMKDSPEEAATAIGHHVSSLVEQDAGDNWADRAYEAVYENETLMGRNAVAALRELRTRGFSASKLNRTRSLVDTAWAKLAKRRPAIKVTPDDADWSFKLKARQMTRFGRAKMDRLRAHEAIALAIRAGMVRRAGHVQVGNDGEEITVDEVPAREVHVDRREARYRQPRQMHRRRMVSREVLAAWFPDKKNEIRLASEHPHNEDETLYDDFGNTDMVELTESWHLPSSRKSDDGCHVYSIYDAILDWRDWDRPTFPIISIGWTRSLNPGENPWFVSMASLIADLQHEVNRIVADMGEAIYHGSQLHIFNPRDSGIKNSHLGRTRKPTTHTTMSGQTPSFVMPNVVAPATMQYLQFLLDQMDQLVGIAEWAQKVQNPLGAGASGVALQQVDDNYSERLSMQETGISYLHQQVFENIIHEAKALNEMRDAGYKAAWHRRTLVQVIDWGAIDMERDQFSLTVEPTSFIPDTRAGKMWMIEQMSKFGAFDPIEMLGGFDSPDLERLMRRKLAPVEMLEMIMELLCDPKEDMGRLYPNSYMNLDLYLEMAKAELCRVTIEGAPDEVQERFREVINRCETILSKGAEAMPDAAQSPMPVPGAEPPPGMAPPPLPGALPPGAAPETLPGAAMPGAVE